MTSHVHAWTPIPLETARYECSCGATGYRGRAGIVEYRHKVARRAEVTARNVAHPRDPALLARKEYDGK